MVLDHVALVVDNPKKSAAWYCEKFDAELLFSDETWAIVQFDNIKLALVVSNEHPGHIAFRTNKLDECQTVKQHRDGTESYYTRDEDGNIIEMIKYPGNSYE